MTTLYSGIPVTRPLPFPSRGSNILGQILAPSPTVTHLPYMAKARFHCRLRNLGAGGYFVPFVAITCHFRQRKGAHAILALCFGDRFETKRLVQ